MAEPSTLPKPFIFVLMPFDARFDDIYKFGIKGAADDVGAYAERVDEQIFTEGILDRIFNQINKADIIVADMTGRNPNVFYEVGYAHALGKIVLLLTQNTDDIPFDLKHHQHTVYGGSIELLREQLSPRLEWAIEESQKLRGRRHRELFSLRVFDVEVMAPGAGNPMVVESSQSGNDFFLRLEVCNESAETTAPISHVYLFVGPNSSVVPLRQGRSGQFSTLESFQASDIDSADGLTKQHRLPFQIPPLPPKAVESMGVPVAYVGPKSHYIEKSDDLFRLRLHGSAKYHEFIFQLLVEYRFTPSYD